ncbi:class I SAM-dependent methyltransferase [Lentzea tibetensis]|uniref:Class I SAM-dependent methyltransferase n=1 Tax=Lentzea tibetensis TaxID=2591470 RepID=A0A563EYK3_9PSEU|nr:class I SAM-dependent methyltransferase [Lentzea tibetensis]TWP52551.1 class I SAM-dependent methyltransferase [Lentzea tibetensis]
MTEAFWEDFYRDRDQVWTGKPNELLVREVAALEPGTALDLGCGEGGDAIWLASLGWQVTAVDVSSVALERAARRASEAGVTVDWQQHDLSVSFPSGSYSLVSAQFFHSPVEVDGERDSVLRKAAAVVAPGGVLLIAGHAGWASHQHDHPADVHFPTTAEVLAALDLGPEWVVEADEVITREVPELGTRADNVLRIRRG